jgi:uncharacterized integral membrane protein
MKQFFVWLLRIVLVTVILTLCVVNRDAVTLRFYPLPYEITLPKFLFALTLFAGGVLTGALLNAGRVFHAKRHQRYESRRVAALEEEIAGLRTEARHTRRADFAPQAPGTAITLPPAFPQKAI